MDSEPRKTTGGFQPAWFSGWAVSSRRLRRRALPGRPRFPAPRTRLRSTREQRPTREFGPPLRRATADHSPTSGALQEARLKATVQPFAGTRPARPPDATSSTFGSLTLMVAYEAAARRSEWFPDRITRRFLPAPSPATWWRAV